MAFSNILRQFVLVLSLFTSMAFPFPSTVDESQPLYVNYKSMEEDSMAHVLQQTVPMKKALESHIGIKFWKSVYGDYGFNNKSGRELTAENCAACAAEENLERVQELKKREDGFKFVTDLFTTLLSPLLTIIKGTGGTTGKQVREGMVQMEFHHLDNLLKTSKSEDKEYIPAKASPMVLLRRPYVEELGKLGILACKEKQTFTAKSYAHIVSDFCIKNLKSFKLLEALNSVMIEPATN